MMIDKWIRRARFPAWMLASLSVSLGAAAQEDGAGSAGWSLRGFGTVAAARSTDGRAEVARDRLQPRGVSDRWSGRTDSDFGLQANYLASDTFEAVVQAVSRYNDRGNFAPELSEALLKYDPNPYVSVRGGRVGTDFFMHGDSRLIGYSQLTVRPNIDYFSSLAVAYLDGADVQATVPLGEALLRAKGYYGRLAEKLPFAGGSLNLRGSRALGAYLDYQEGAWQWRGGMAKINFRHPLPEPVADLQASLRGTAVASAQQAADALELQGSDARYYSLGMTYDRGPLLVQAMLGRLRYESKAIQGQDAALFLAGYRVGEVKPYVGYSRVRSHATGLSSGLPDTGAGAEINASLASLLAASHADQHTYSAGLRWDFRRDMALKVQADVVRGKPDSVYTFRRTASGWDGKTHVLTFVLDFVF